MASKTNQFIKESFFYCCFFFLIYFALEYLTISPLYLFLNPSALMFPFCLSLCPLTLFLGVPSSPPVIFRWIWRWLCLVRGKIRRSRCLCSGCLWSVSRCCWRPCQVTLTRSPKILFRLWTSSHGICLPWGTDAHHLCLLYKHTTHIVFASVDSYCFSSFFHWSVLLNFLLSFDQIILCNVIAVPDALCGTRSFCSTV